MKRVVAALIVRDDEVLICQRTRHQAMPLKWEFPGGKIEEGEDYHVALRRELEEELGIDAVIGPELRRLQHTYKNGGTLELSFFLVEDYAGAIDNRIFKDVRWVHRSALPDFDFLEADVPLVREIASGALRLRPARPA
jgi:8-oxo-dGTP diphosphatase